jgi:hypothetical protein
MKVPVKRIRCLADALIDVMEIREMMGCAVSGMDWFPAVAIERPRTASATTPFGAAAPACPAREESEQMKRRLVQRAAASFSNQDAAAFNSRSRIMEAPPKTNFGRAHDR